MREGNMRFGFYYSQAQDWHEPNGAGNSWDFPPNDKKDFDKYLRDNAEPQVRELLTAYGPVALIWFDTPQLMTTERAKRFIDLVRSLQPNTLIDGRLDRRRLRQHRRQRDPGETAPGVVGNAATINHTWGYRTTTTTGRGGETSSSWSTSSARAAITCSTLARWPTA